MHFPLRHFAELDSTNSEATRLAHGGEAGPLWIVADHQTAGRGRRGRVWRGASGNLAATLLLTTERPSVEVAQMAFVTALAVADMAAAFVPADVVRLKWPNDLMVAGAKAGGVLIETGVTPVPLEREGRWLAIGIGVNLVEAPADTPYPATALADHGERPTRDRALEVLDVAFDRWLTVWDQGDFEPLRVSWTARAHGLGEPCTVALGDRRLTGVNEGLDADGALLLRVDATVQRITAGDVIFGGV